MQTHAKELAEEVRDLTGAVNGGDYLGVYATHVAKRWLELEADKKEEFKVTAANWKAQTPPAHVQQK